MSKKDEGEDGEVEDEDEDENPFVTKDLKGYGSGKEANLFGIMVGLFGIDVDEVGTIPSSKHGLV
jgi:hypothetical protein